MIHDATPSWSGYNYQGKLALHYVLSHICEKLSADPTYNFHGDSIVLENNEDFELFVGGELVSFHQVKAYEKQSFSSYDEALFGLALNLYSQPGPLGYIHTWKVINLPAGKNLQQAIEDFIRELISEHDAAPANSTIFKAVNVAQDRNKTARIIKQAFDGLTVEQVYDALQTIVADPLLALARIHSYMYDGRPCCSIDDINDFIKSKLQEVLVIRGGVNTTKQIDSGFHHLLEMVDVYVTERHLQKQASDLLHIEISDIVTILDANYEDVSSRYLAVKFKERFFCLFDEFVNNPDYYSTPEDLEGFVCNLSQIRYALLNADPEKLFSYYKNFSPCVKFDSLTNIEQAFAVNENGVTDVLLRIFNAINCESCENDEGNNKLVYRSLAKPANYYLPTTINDRSPTSIAKKLRANTRIVEDLYEVNHMIYGGPQKISLNEQATTHTTAPPSANVVEEEPRDDYFSNLQLIPIQQAMDELNAD
ncbi:ABC-three component system protein [Pseudomonas fluorescens]|uniref:ABC-three component system protein n=1 Tax=Pseudomonas fluorescens TaxID=294 RepID=UPI002B1D6A55|nr:ABC-three component system protein [Pseudomonas fluorescens]